jgi:pimeloyl-ACP methyl ester carboxylesterase
MPNSEKNPEPRDLLLSGKKLHVWIGGTGPALLLLHAAWGDAEMSWAPVWRDLGQSFTVIAPDLSGFGASDPTDVRSLSATVLVLKELLDNLKIDRAIVAGNSFGAANAIEFASTLPERTLHLVAVNGTNLPIMPAFLKKLISLPVLEERFRMFMRTMSFSDRAFSKAFSNRDILPAGFFDRISRYEEKHSRIVFESFMNQTAPQKRPVVPATIIWGMKDRLVPHYQLAKLRKWLASPRFVPIEDAGHMPQVERPAEFVDAVKSVVEKSQYL